MVVWEGRTEREPLALLTEPIPGAMEQLAAFSQLQSRMALLPEKILAGAAVKAQLKIPPEGEGGPDPPDRQLSKAT